MLWLVTLTCLYQLALSTVDALAPFIAIQSPPPPPTIASTRVLSAPWPSALSLPAVLCRATALVVLRSYMPASIVPRTVTPTPPPSTRPGHHNQDVRRHPTGPALILGGRGHHGTASAGCREVVAYVANVGAVTGSHRTDAAVLGAIGRSSRRPSAGYTPLRVGPSVARLHQGSRRPLHRLRRCPTPTVGPPRPPRSRRHLQQPARSPPFVYPGPMCPRIDPNPRNSVLLTVAKVSICAATCDTVTDCAY